MHLSEIDLRTLLIDTDLMSSLIPHAGFDLESIMYTEFKILKIAASIYRASKRTF